MFSIHGEFVIKVCGNTMFIDAAGPFNEEMVELYKTEIEFSFKQIKAITWNQVITLNGLSLFIPKAEQELTKSIKIRKSNGLTHCAIVLFNVEGKSLITDQFTRCYQRAEVIIRFFDTMQEAKEWIYILSKKLELNK